MIHFSEFLSFDIRHDFCFQQIGENDSLSSDKHSIARNILSLASYLHGGLGISYVIIGQFFRRQPWATSSDFKVELYKCQQSSQGRFGCFTRSPLWYHRVFWNSMDFLCPDDVHLQCTGGVVVLSPMHKFKRSIRSAVLHIGANSSPV